MKTRCVVATLFCLAHLSASAQELGSPPRVSLNARDPVPEFRLPALKDDPTTPLGSAVRQLQVGERAASLGLSLGSAVETWQWAEAQLELLHDNPASSPGIVATFDGGTAEALNALLADPTIESVRVTAPELLLDRPLTITRDNISIAFGDARILGASAYLVRIEKARAVRVTGGIFTGHSSGILVADSDRVEIAQARFEAMSGNGIVVTGTSSSLIRSSRFTGLGGAPVTLHRGTTGSVIVGNTIFDNHGPSNWQAGIVVSDREVDLTADPMRLMSADRYGVVEQPITERLSPPRRNLIAGNTIARNKSSGVYVDGAIQTVVARNLIEANSKEGLCLDNGATANVVAENDVQENGKRWGKTDDILRKDFILDHGRLQDGTAAAKVPGLSIDNALYNIVFGNFVARNHGGGIKLVRTDHFNVIGLNTLLSNNEGASDRFHFFGIELGAARADSPARDLDFTPSRGNIVFSNIVQGRHYAGIFLAEGSDRNDVFDNVILGATDWALESVIPQANASLNNLTNLKSRNIGNGLDATLVPPSQR